MLNEIEAPSDQPKHLEGSTEIAFYVWEKSRHTSPAK